MTTIITASVSRLAPNKEGYDLNRKTFGNSFKLESLTVNEFIFTLTKEGYPITAPHQPEAPLPLAQSRGVSTFRHTENFVMSGHPLTFLLLDDDGNYGDDAWSFYMNDPFFNKYGYFIYETSSSSPAKRKVRPCFIFEDFTVTTPAAFTHMVSAFHQYYDGRTDKLTDVIRVFYGAKDTNKRILGHKLPESVYMEEVLTPYLESEARKKLIVEEERINRFQLGRDRSIGVRDNYARALITGKLRWLVEHCRNLSEGDSRNSKLYWAGRVVAGGLNAFWASDHLDLFNNIEDDIYSAFNTNGYAAKYGGEKEIRRVYGRGLAVGGTAWQTPEVGDQWFLYEVGEWVSVTKDNELFTGQITERKRPRDQNGLPSPSYKLTDGRLYPEVRCKLAEQPKKLDLSMVKPPLLLSQTTAIEQIIEEKVTEAYVKGFLDGYEAAGYPIPGEIAKMFGFSRISDNQNEYLLIDLKHDGMIVNQQRLYPDGSSTYEVDVPTPLWSPELLNGEGSALILPTVVDASKFYLSSIKDGEGKPYEIHAIPPNVLPQSLDFEKITLVQWVGNEVDPATMAILYGRENVWLATLPIDPKDLTDSTIQQLFSQSVSKKVW